MPALAGRLGRLCACHPWWTVLCWLLFAAVTSGLAYGLAPPYAARSGIPGTESSVAADRVAAAFPGGSAPSATVVVTANNGGTLTTGPTRGALRRLNRSVHALPHVAGAGQRPELSRDRRAALLDVSYRSGWRPGEADLHRLRRDIDTHTGGVLRVLITGTLPRDASVSSNSTAERAGFVVAIVLLCIAFGSLVSALVPVVTGAVTLVAGLGLVRLLAVAYPVDSSAPALAGMIGLGVGIDYALFIVTRHREELDHGNTPLAAVGRATATAGASVTYAGVTVVVAIAGLATAGVPLITSLGLASMLVVVVAMLAALTLVPALLAVAGRRIDALRLPLLRRHPPLDPDLVEGPVPHAQRWASHIERHPLLYTLASGILLLVFAAPASVLRLGEPDDGVLPAHTELRRAYQTIATHYGVGRNAPLSVVVAAPPGGRLDAERLDRTLQPALRAVTDVASAGPAVVSPGGSTAVLTVVPASAPQDARTTALVGRLRDRLHRLAGRLPDRLLVTGGPAGTVDFTNRLTARLPLFVGVVLAVSFLLLMLVFRSLLVPLKAVVLDLLSILAAYGVVVAGFQWGWLTGVFGLSGSMPVVEVVPMMMFAIVFGLSMDYEVFLLSRVRERWRVTGDNARSVVSGLASTARVISSAAAIMVCVFLAFTFSAAAVVTMMGLGLAAAVLIDATIVRLVLVPGMMVLFDRGNWWLPRWLDRILPHVHIED